MFDKLAAGVIRHHKKIIVVWILALILSVPLMIRINEVIVYEETAFAPEDLESVEAQDVINEQFPGSIANSSAMIVLQSQDVTGSSAKDFAMSLEENVTSDPDIEYLQGFTSIFTLYEDILGSAVNGMAPALHQIENATNGSVFLFYGLPSIFSDTWAQVNGTCFMVYGIPGLYLDAWYSSGGDDVLANVRTSENLTVIVDLGIANGKMNQTSANLMWAYYFAFYANWTSSAGNASLVANPPLRAQFAIDNATGNITSLMPMEQQLFINGIHQSFNLTNSANTSIQSSYTNVTFWTVMGTYGLAYGDMNVTPYYDGFYNAWENSFAITSLINSTSGERAMYAINIAAPQYINSLPIADDEKQLMFSIINSQIPIYGGFNQTTGTYEILGIYSFNTTNWSNTTLVHAFSISTISSMMGVDDIGFIEEVYLLGPSPSDDTIASFSANIVKNGTLVSYPVPIPTALYSGFISPDNGTMLLMIGFTRGANEIGGGDQITENIGIIRTMVGEIKADIGNDLTVFVSGDAALSADVAEQVATDIERVDPVTVALVIILLSLFFMSIVTPFVPLLVIGVAILVSQGVIFIVGTYIASIHYSAIMIMFPLILAVGVDYSIFIIARYREERKEGHNREEAVRTSLTWAGESIATSGGVVMVSFGALSIASFGMMRTLGLAMMIGVAMALVAALTFLPSLLLILGNRIFWPSRNLKRRTWLDSKNNMNPGKRNPGDKTDKKKGARQRRRRGYFGRAARFSIKHAKAIVLLALLVSIPTTYAALNLESSFDFIAAMPDTEAKLGMDAMAEGFGRGNILKTYVVVQTDDELYNGTDFDEETLNSIDNLTARIEVLDNIERVESSLMQTGTRIDYATWQGFSDEERESMIAQAIGEDNSTVLLTVVLEDEPFSPRSMETMPVIRTEIEDAKNDEQPLANAQILIGGATASMKDIQDSMAGDFSNMVVIVIVGIFILLLIVLGSVLIPLRLIVTILLSISWALALTMFLFVWVNGIPVIWLMPMILFIIIMGLGMDYDIFLVTRIREEVAKGASDEKAIVKAVERTGGIITACGMIMAGAFASLMLSSMGLLQEFGFGLAFAIIIDAMIIRIYLVPAIMILLKKWNWWAPGRLQRVRLEDKGGKRKQPAKKKAPEKDLEGRKPKKGRKVKKPRAVREAAEPEEEGQGKTPEKKPEPKKKKVKIIKRRMKSV
jgi:RND superfamily putative drug exporter